MNIRVPIAVLQNTGLSCGAKLLYAYILEKAGDGKALSQESICRDLGIKRSATLRSYTSELVKYNLIGVYSGKSVMQCNVYIPKDGKSFSLIKTDPLYIYFIQEGDNGPIKIGISRDPENRVRAIQVSCSKTTKLLCSVLGTVEKESALHEQFKNIRLHGEWFKPSKELVDFIAKLKSAEGTCIAN